MEVIEYDVVIVGTSLVQSILAAAFARSGRKVLYVDDATFYGGENATLSFAEFSAFLSKPNDRSSVEGSFAEISSKTDDNGERGTLLSTISGSSLSAFRPFRTTGGEAEEGTRPSVRVNDYNIDLTARLVFCRGSCVDVLAECGVSRYLEFQTLDGTFYLPDENASPLLVPQSKSQVFASSALSMVEKRQLMRFLQFCLDYNQNHDEVEWTNERLGAQNPGRSLTRPQNKSEDSDLKEKAIKKPNEPLNTFLLTEVRMSNRLADIVLCAIAREICKSDPGRLTVSSGMRRVGTYLNALGRFGATPFLTPMYGCGEICQGFSRLCAVYGGTCALGVRPEALYSNGISFRVEAQKSDDERPSDKLPPFVKYRAACVVDASFFAAKDPYFSGYTDEVEVRGICLVSGSVFDEGFNRTFFVIPSNGSDGVASVHGIQLDHRAKVVADKQYMIQLTTRALHRDAIEAAKTKLSEIMNKLVVRKSDANIQVVWRTFFIRNVIAPRPRDSSSHLSPKLFVTSSAQSNDPNDAIDVDLDDAFLQAERIFSSVCPNEPFLPASESEMRVRQEERNEQVMMMPDMQG